MSEALSREMGIYNQWRRCQQYVVTSGNTSVISPTCMCTSVSVCI